MRLKYFLLLLIIPGAFAFTIAPSTIEYDFISGGTYDGNICIVGGEDKIFNVSFEGSEIISSINLNSEFIPSKDYDCQNYTFKTNYFVDEQREYELFVYVTEFDPDVSNENGIVFVTRIGQKLIIDATEAPLKEEVSEIGFTFTLVALTVFILAVLTLLFIRRKRN